MQIYINAHHIIYAYQCFIKLGLGNEIEIEKNMCRTYILIRLCCITT